MPLSRNSNSLGFSLSHLLPLISFYWSLWTVGKDMTEYALFLHTYYVLCTCMYYLYKGLIFLMDHLYVHSIYVGTWYMLHFTLVLLYFYRNFWRKKKKVSAYLLTQQNLNTTASIWPAKPTIKRSTTIMLRTLYLSLCTVSRDGIFIYMTIRILRYPNTWISRPILLSKYPDTKKIEVSKYPII